MTLTSKIQILSIATLSLATGFLHAEPICCNPTNSGVIAYFEDSKSLYCNLYDRGRGPQHIETDTSQLPAIWTHDGSTTRYLCELEYSNPGNCCI